MHAVIVTNVDSPLADDPPLPPNWRLVKKRLKPWRLGNGLRISKKHSLSDQSSNKIEINARNREWHQVSLL